MTLIVLFAHFLFLATFMTEQVADLYRSGNCSMGRVSQLECPSSETELVPAVSALIDGTAAGALGCHTEWQRVK